MLKRNLPDLAVVGIISGIIAILTSTMGISGTIIGSVVSSVGIQIMTILFRDPLKDKMNQKQQEIKTDYYIDYNNTKKNSQKEKKSYINTKTLFIFPLAIIVAVELIHFLGIINIIPYDIFYSLEKITNWTLFKTIGCALIVMGFYPIFSKDLGFHHGIILILVGIFQLIMGIADTNFIAYNIYSVIAPIRELMSIVVIIAIVYCIFTIPDSEIILSKETPQKSTTVTAEEFEKISKNQKSFKNHKKNRKNRKKDDFNKEDYYFYYDE